MKVGILTLPLHANYGGNLQAVALMHYLKNLGHSPVLLDRRIDLDWPWINPGKYLRRAKAKYLDKNSSVNIHGNWTTRYHRRIVAKNARPFLNRFANPKTAPVYSSSGLRKAVKNHELEGIIVGSDQIWRPRYVPSIRDSYLEFLEGIPIKKIAYAASFGTDKWEYSQQDTSHCSTLLKRFDAVSVREYSAVAMCREKLGCDAEWLVDPTLLLDASFYRNEIIGQSEPIPTRPHLGVYVLDASTEKRQWIDKVAEHLHLGVRPLNAPSEDNNRSLSDRIAPPVESWLHGIASSEATFVDSFHGCIFSILYHKPFWAFVNEDRGAARFESLLKLFGLEHRMVRTGDCYKSSKTHEPIDWESVDGTLIREREKAASFLSRSLI